MDTAIKVATLQNDPVAADVDTSSSAGFYLIKGLPPIRKEDFISVSFTAPVAEVAQVVTIGGAAAVTIVANTLYKLGLGNTGDQREGWMNSIRKYNGQVSALSGDATVDRFNVYSSIVWKAMQQTNFAINNCYLGVKCTLTFVGATAITYTATNGPVFVRGSVSGSVGFLIASSTAVAMTLNVTNSIAPVVTDVFTIIADPYTGRTPTGTGGPTSGTGATVVVLGVAITAIDRLGYFPAKGTRQGKNSFYAFGGFAAANASVAITTAAVYSIGQGTRMLDDVPVPDVHYANLVAGQYYFPTNQAPIAGATYEVIIVKTRPLMDQSALSDIGGNTVLDYLVYANIAGTSGVYGAYAAALAALT